MDDYIHHSGLFWNPRVAHTSSHAARQANEASREAGRAHRSVEELEQTVDRLSLICQGMWNLLRDHLEIDEKALIEEVRRVDLMDGKEDGRLNRGPKQCAACKRMSNARHDHCLYCGDELKDDSAFDRI